MQELFLELAHVDGGVFDQGGDFIEQGGHFGIVAQRGRQAAGVVQQLALDLVAAAFERGHHAALLGQGEMCIRDRLSAVLKRWEDDGRKHDDLPLVRWCMAQGYAEIEKRMDQVLSNLPGRPLAWALRAAILPLGLAKGPDLSLIHI